MMFPFVLGTKTKLKEEAVIRFGNSGPLNVSQKPC